jgi:hypothetical protein
MWATLAWSCRAFTNSSAELEHPLDGQVEAERRSQELVQALLTAEEKGSSQRPRAAEATVHALRDPHHHLQQQDGLQARQGLESELAPQRLER